MLDCVSCKEKRNIILHYWTHRFGRIGHINSASSVRPFVCPFVHNADISGSACQNFLIFCTKLKQHKCRKLMFSYFHKKLLTLCGRGQKVKFGPKLDFFKDCFQTACQNFSIFCIKLDNNKAFQTMGYPQENSCPGPPGVKRSNFGPKIDFFKN